jgi:hypothetical protein
MSIGGGLEYRIKWRGWGSRWNTWEPERHIIDQVILTEWEETKGAPRGVGRPLLRLGHTPRSGRRVHVSQPAPGRDTYSAVFTCLLLRCIRAVL